MRHLLIKLLRAVPTENVLNTVDESPWDAVTPREMREQRVADARVRAEVPGYRDGVPSINRAR
ncbi:hypothetical protein [Streptomyces sp. UNOB3_S3]|uniref:hypothetical protein n=1 Tax=Streptomyces sp. UNOB3_S3 TaxID=2871682 RepID=UPI001E3F0497|nr:hypothetical protein [Streptomyces sp. UNOB3_S3]MCC3773503.1 hypothetical protein [Streptomyces sp. UNOB3_S3]